MSQNLAILGAGNIGRAIALGLAGAGTCPPERVILTRRRPGGLEDLAARGFRVEASNLAAVRAAEWIVLAVQPSQLDGLLREIAPALEPERHVLVSVVSGATIGAILGVCGKPLPVVRAMPNTAIAVGASMTCLAANSADERVLGRAVQLFEPVGAVAVIDEEHMIPATALCACGIAFFLRSIRAASQGGIEIGFHPEEALTMAAQTALGAARLVLERNRHPEREIDGVTTPRGCTIAGLNEMEHQGFSSALIKGIVTSAVKAGSLYGPDRK